MDCSHKETRVVATRPFAWQVGVSANPAAHGGVCETVECQNCLARRQVNLNGVHEEAGSWGAGLVVGDLVRGEHGGYRDVGVVRAVGSYTNTAFALVRWDTGGETWTSPRSLQVKEAR